MEQQSCFDVVFTMLLPPLSLMSCQKMQHKINCDTIKNCTQKRILITLMNGIDHTGRNIIPCYKLIVP